VTARTGEHVAYKRDKNLTCVRNSGGGLTNRPHSGTIKQATVSGRDNGSIEITRVRFFNLIN